MDGGSAATSGVGQKRWPVLGHFTWPLTAGLADLRIHDLRHSFASFLVNGGRSIYEVQKILGHTQIRTTLRYAHLSQETLLEAASTAMNSVPAPASLSPGNTLEGRPTRPPRTAITYSPLTPETQGDASGAG